MDSRGSRLGRWILIGLVLSFVGVVAWRLRSGGPSRVQSHGAADALSEFRQVVSQSSLSEAARAQIILRAEAEAADD
jgi:hypothetical protein